MTTICPPHCSIHSHCSWYASPISSNRWDRPPGSWSVPAPQTIECCPAVAAAVERWISSRTEFQSRPIPRCAVSIASATPNPCDQRCSRNRRVVSQSIAAPTPLPFSASGSATTCAAAYALRLSIFETVEKLPPGPIVYCSNLPGLIGSRSVLRFMVTKAPGLSSVVPATIGVRLRLTAHLSLPPARCRERESPQQRAG